MNIVSPEAISYCKDMYFTFSKTLKDQRINLDDYSSYNFIIDITGVVYQGASVNPNSCTVCLIGGINMFANAKAVYTPSQYYITEQQKVTLYRVMRDLARYSDSSTITSDNDKLEQSLNALYLNYCG
jgi:hypothetical protein